MKKMNKNWAPLDIWEWKMFQGSEGAECLSHKVAWLPDHDNDFKLW